MEFVLVEHHMRLPGTNATYCGLPIPEWVVEVRSALVKHEDVKKCAPLCGRCEILAAHQWHAYPEDGGYHCSRCGEDSKTATAGRFVQCKVEPKEYIIDQGSPGDRHYRKAAPEVSTSIRAEFKEIQDKVLAVLDADPESTVAWALLRKEVCHNEKLLGAAVRNLLNEGAIEEPDKMVYQRTKKEA